MDIQFERPVEAMAAITWLICSADDVGSVEERNYLHEQVRHSQDFAEMSAAEFTTLLASTRTKLFSNLENNGFCLAAPAVESVIQSASSILNETQKIQAYKMAVNLAASDCLVDSETEVLDKLRISFGLSGNVVGS